MNDSDDAYDILGVSNDASSQEIKKAYRKLALLNHPDKQTTEEEREKAHAVFSKISNAYQILSDEESRRQYDIRKQCGVSQDVNSNTHNPAEQQPMYTSYSTSTPPQRHQRTTFSSFPGSRKSSQPRPKKTSYSTSTTYHTSSPGKTRVTTSSQTSDGSSGDDDNNFTFSFTSSDFNPKFDDPYEMFQKIFEKEYGRPFDARNNDIPVSPTKKTPTKSRKTTQNVTVSSPTSSSPAQKMKNGMTTLFSSPRTAKPMNNRKVSTTKSKAQPRTIHCVPVTSSSMSSPSTSSDVVSSSTKTRTVCHADGTQEVITETSITRADGSTETSVQSSKTNTKSASNNKTRPKVVMSRRLTTQ